MKNIIEIILGGIGGLVITLCGGFDIAMRALLIFMILDYVMGLIVAGVFHKSKKSEHGSLSSVAGWTGITKKIATLFMIVVAYHLDVVLNINYIRNTACMAFIVNEGLSILENYTLMGGTGTDVLKKALDVLKNKKDNSM